MKWAVDYKWAKNGGQNRRYRQIGVAVFSILMMAGLTACDDASTAAYNLMALDQSIAAACTDNYNRMGQKFGQVPVSAGCACTAKHATSEYSLGELSTFVNAHAVLINRYSRMATARSNQQQKTIAMQTDSAFENMRAGSGLGKRRFDGVIRSVVTIDKICRDAENHLGQAFTDLAALKPVGFVPPELEEGLDVKTAEVTNPGAINPGQLRLRGSNTLKLGEME